MSRSQRQADALPRAAAMPAFPNDLAMSSRLSISTGTDCSMTSTGTLATLLGNAVASKTVLVGRAPMPPLLKNVNT